MAGRLPGPGHSYDVAIVGAGISGSEAAYACAEVGLDTLLVTTSLDTVYGLLGDGVTLNPPAGTLMAQVHQELADGCGYVGNWAFHRRAKKVLEQQPTLHLLQSNVSALLAEGDRVSGVSTWEGVDRLARKVALCVGSFLAARLTVGELTEQAGRLSEMAYDDLYQDLKARGFAFKPLTLSADPQGGSLAYTVRCQRFAEREWQRESFMLPRVRGLYAAGVCACGYLPFEAAARQGRALAAQLSVEA